MGVGEGLSDEGAREVSEDGSGSTAVAESLEAE